MPQVTAQESSDAQRLAADSAMVNAAAASVAGAHRTTCVATSSALCPPSVTQFDRGATTSIAADRRQVARRATTRHDQATQRLDRVGT